MRNGADAAALRVEAFIDEMVREFRGRLALLADGGDRRALEDGIALLTDYRLSGMDAPRLERLLTTMRDGRSPVRLSVLKPQAVARELTRRWREYEATHAAGLRRQA